MKKVNFKNKWMIAIVALFGISLVSSGVFAAATITLNSGNPVNLGAGAAAVDVCDSSATISTAQTYDSGQQRFELTTITLSNVNTTACVGKTLAMALKIGTTTYSTTWGVASASGDQTFTWGQAAGTGYTSYTAFPADIDTANSNITTIALSAQ
jgi:hypothetical protein